MSDPKLNEEKFPYLGFLAEGIYNEELIDSQRWKHFTTAYFLIWLSFFCLFLTISTGSFLIGGLAHPDEGALHSAYFSISRIAFFNTVLLFLIRSPVSLIVTIPTISIMLNKLAV